MRDDRDRERLREAQERMSARKSLAQAHTGGSVSAGRSVGRSTRRHDRMFKSHIVDQPLNRSALRIGAAYSEIPIAMRMRPCIAQDDLAECALPCLGGTASFPNKAGDQ